MRDVSVAPLLNALQMHKTLAGLDLSHNLLGKWDLCLIYNLWTLPKEYLIFIFINKVPKKCYDARCWALKIFLLKNLCFTVIGNIPLQEISLLRTSDKCSCHQDKIMVVLYWICTTIVLVQLLCFRSWISYYQTNIQDFLRISNGLANTSVCSCTKTCHLSLKLPLTLLNKKEKSFQNAYTSKFLDIVIGYC